MPKPPRPSPPVSPAPSPEDLAFVHPSLHPFVVPVASVRLDPKNARVHPREQIEALAVLISRFGFRSVINVSRASGVCEAGEARLLAARRLGMRFVPVSYNDDSDAAARAYSLVDNRAAALSAFDDDRLREVARSLAGVGFDLRELGLSDAQVSRVMAGPKPEVRVVRYAVCPCCSHRWEA